MRLLSEFSTAVRTPKSSRSAPPDPQHRQSTRRTKPNKTLKSLPFFSLSFFLFLSSSSFSSSSLTFPTSSCIQQPERKLHGPVDLFYFIFLLVYVFNICLRRLFFRLISRPAQHQDSIRTIWLSAPINSVRSRCRFEHNQENKKRRRNLSNRILEKKIRFKNDDIFF